MKKKVPLSIQEHEELALDLAKAQKILEPWVDRFYKAYSVNGREVAELKKTLNLISSKTPCLQDDHWYHLPEEQKKSNSSPYYGIGRIAWM